MPAPVRRFFNNHSLLSFYLLFVFFCFLTQITNGISWASLTSNALNANEYWRLITGHFVHYSWEHLGFNIAGAGLCLLVFRKDLPSKHWLISALLISLFSSLCMLFFHTFSGRYFGFSDTLYGWIIMGILALRTSEKLLGNVLLILLTARLLYEVIFPGSPFENMLGGAMVAKKSHLFGLIGGVLYTYLCIPKMRRRWLKW